MKGDTQHLILAGYASWSKLEQTGGEQLTSLLYYRIVLNSFGYIDNCQACVSDVTNTCKNVSKCYCCTLYIGVCPSNHDSLFSEWSKAKVGGSDKKLYAGDIAQAFKEWGKREGVFA